MVNASSIMHTYDTVADQRPISMHSRERGGRSDVDITQSIHVGSCREDRHAAGAPVGERAHGFPRSKPSIDIDASLVSISLVSISLVSISLVSISLVSISLVSISLVSISLVSISCRLGRTAAADVFRCRRQPQHCSDKDRCIPSL